MSLKARRILYISFILIFFTITPIVFLYASGYKLKNGLSLQKTGMMAIKTEPSGAKIYLNGKPQKLFLKNIFSKNDSYIGTPAKFKNILPGEYDVKLELENYWPWEKKLIVSPGQATFAEDIILFKKSLPLSLYNNAENNFVLSPAKDKFLIFSRDKVSIFNITDEEYYDIKTATSSGRLKPVDIAWSPKETKIIIDGWLFYENNGSVPLKLADILGKNAFNFKWSNDDDNKIFYQTDSGINSYDLSEKINKNIIADLKTGDFLVKSNNLYITIKNGPSAQLINFNISGDKISGRLDLPLAEYKFISPENKFLGLYDKNHNILYLIDPFSEVKPLQEIIDNAVLTVWIDDSRLLYSNGYEIWMADFNTGDKTLFTRISNKINSLAWHASGNYIIYSTDNSLNIIELDNRGRYNFTKLIELENIANIYLNDNGDTLYFYAQIGNQKGLYKLAL